jgi:hypothetical protein
MPLSSSGGYFCQCCLGFVKRSHGDDSCTAESRPDTAPQTQDFPFIEQILDYPGLIIPVALGIFPADLLPEVETRIEQSLLLKNVRCALSSFWIAAGHDGVHG